MDGIAVLLKDIKQTYKPLSKTEAAYFARQRDEFGIQHAKGKEAIEALVCSCTPWAVKIASGQVRKFSERVLSLQEAICIALESLLHACHKFDPNKGTLSTIVAFTVRRNIQRHVLCDSSIFHMSSAAGNAAMGNPQKDHPIRPETLKAAKRALSAHQELDADELHVECKLYESDLFLDQEDHWSKLNRVKQALPLLSEGQQEVMREVIAGKTLRSISKTRGVSFQRIQQIRKDSIRKLRLLLLPEEYMNEQFQQQ